MSNGFTRRKEHSKEDIRRAAGELFSQFGVERVSIADIARKAGVSQATIYNNFENKETLAHEFVTAAVEQLVSQVQAVLTPEMPYREKMGAVIRFISEMMAHVRPPETERAVFSLGPDLLNDPEIRKIRDSAREKMTDLLLGLVREGKEQGQIDPALSEDAFRLYFLAFMDIFTDAQLQHRYSRNPGLVEDLGRMMMYGISGDRV